MLHEMLYILTINAVKNHVLHYSNVYSIIIQHFVHHFIHLFIHHLYQILYCNLLHFLPKSIPQFVEKTLNALCTLKCVQHSLQAKKTTIFEYHILYCILVYCTSTTTINDAIFTPTVTQHVSVVTNIPPNVKQN